MAAAVVIVAGVHSGLVGVDVVEVTIHFGVIIDGVEADSTHFGSGGSHGNVGAVGFVAVISHEHAVAGAGSDAQHEVAVGICGGIALLA